MGECRPHESKMTLVGEEPAEEVMVDGDDGGAGEEGCDGEHGYEYDEEDEEEEEIVMDEEEYLRMLDKVCTRGAGPTQTILTACTRVYKTSVSDTGVFPPASQKREVELPR